MRQAVPLPMLGTADAGGIKVAATVRRLVPDCGEEKLEDLYRHLDFPPPPESRPYIYLNMVATADGAAHLGGRTFGMGSEADRLAFRRLREYCDAVLVGAGTVRAERYGPPRLDPEARGRRLRRGLAPVPRMVVVSRSLDLDPQLRLFRDPSNRPAVLTTEDADPERRRRLAPVAEVLGFGVGGVDLPAALGWLRGRGVRWLLCEGGPTLNAHLLAGGVVDELLLTLAPRLVGGDAGRIVAGHLPSALHLDLVELREFRGELLLRYRVGSS